MKQTVKWRRNSFLVFACVLTCALDSENDTQFTLRDFCIGRSFAHLCTRLFVYCLIHPCMFVVPQCCSFTQTFDITFLSVPVVRTQCVARSFTVAAPKISHSLPPALWTCRPTSPDTFRRHSKTQHCQQVFQSFGSDSAIADHCTRL